MEAVTGIILSGGKSSRMGRDKGLMQYKGMPLIEHALNMIRPFCWEILISANHKEYGIYGYPVIKDNTRAIGPLGGIISCLPKANSQKVFITACDIPEVREDILYEMFHLLMNYDMVFLSLPKKRIQPLPLGLSKKALTIIEMQLKDGNYALRDMIRACQETPAMTNASINMEKSPININTISDLDNHEIR